MVKYEHLIGVHFDHGWNDCYSLLQRFFKDNFGLEMRNYARPELWWQYEMNLYMDNLEREGFRIVENDSIRNLRPADVFLIAVRSKVPTHAAINLGDGKILHHFVNRLSEVTTYKGIWRNNTLCVIRHPSVPDLRHERQQLDLMDYLPAHKRRLLNAE